MVESAEPLAGMDVGAADSVELDASADPGTTENVVAALRAPEDAVIVIEPASWPTIVTEATPAVEAFEPRPETVPAPDVFVKVTGETAAARLPAGSRSSTVRVRADPEASALLALVNRIAVAVPATTENDAEADARPEDEAVTVTGPAAVPVIVIAAVPPEVDVPPSPETVPLPPDCANEMDRPESDATRLPFTSSTRTFRASVPPAARSVEADEK